MTFDVAVIGGGILGRAIAHAAATRGLKTVCVFARADLNTSATAAAGAMLSTISEVYLSEETVPQQTALRLRLDGYSMYEDWIDCLGVTDEEVKRTRGTFLIASPLNRTDRDALSLIRRTASTHDVIVETVKSRDIPGLAPELGAEPVDALYVRNEGSIDSGALLAQLETALLRNSNTLFTDTTALSIAQRDGVVFVATRQGEICAKEVVIACGAYSSVLLKNSGLDTVGIPDVFAGRGVSALLEQRFDLPHVIRTPNRSFACGIHVVPRCNGLVYLGATNRFSTTPSPDLVPTVGELNPLLMQGAQQINSGLRMAGIRATSVGQRPLTLDRLPIVGRTHHASILVASGTYRNGIVMAPLIARLISEEIETPGIHVSHPFSPKRLISNSYLEQRQQWLSHSASAIVESLVEIQGSSRLHFEASLYALVYTALSTITGEDKSIAPLRDKVIRFLGRTPIEEALPSLIEIFSRAPISRQSTNDTELCE